MAPLLETNTAIFVPLQDYIHTLDHTDADLMGLIADYIPTQPAIAFALARHAADILREFGEEEMHYNHVIAQVLWRTYFSPEHAPLYSTDNMLHDPAALQHFAQCLIDPSKIRAEDVATPTPRSFRH